jgi:hypothetical protein
VLVRPMWHAGGTAGEDNGGHDMGDTPTRL